MATTVPSAAEIATSANPTTSFEEIMGLEREYLLQNYGRYPLALHRGKGCYVYDLEGKRYLDLISGIGVNSLGLCASTHHEGDSAAGGACCSTHQTSTTTSTKGDWQSAWPKQAVCSAPFFAIPARNVWKEH